MLRRIAFIVFAQRIGLTLEEIGVELGKLPPDRAPTRKDWARLSSGWSGRIDDRIAELEMLVGYEKRELQEEVKRLQRALRDLHEPTVRIQSVDNKK